jgi:hypothetical protein
VLLDRILEEWAQLGIRTLFLEGRGRDEGLAPGRRPVVAASPELEVGLAKETVVESSLSLGCGIHTATLRIAEGDSIDPPRGFAVSRTGGQ